MGRIRTKQNPNPWKEDQIDKKKVRAGSTAMTSGLTSRNYQRKCYVRDLCIEWQQKYGQELRPVCPELKKWVNEVKLSDMANIQKTNSTMLDSIKRILLVFDRLIQWPPTERVIAWCAHRKNILEDCLSFVENDLSLLPKRLESSYPDTSRRCDQLIAQLHIDRFRYKFHHPQSFLYLIPPPSTRRHYLLLLDWRQKQMVIAKAKGLEAIEMNRLTSPYPAEAVKTMNEICQELAPLAQIITEKPAEVCEKMQPGKQAKRNSKSKKRKESDKYKLIGALLELHGFETENVRLEPVVSKELEKKLEWNQPKVHREMKKLFGDKPMQQYKQCFSAEKKLTGFMKKLKDGTYDVDGIVESDQK